MKKLAITQNEKPFYGHKNFISLFHGLKELTISDYRGSMCLFTSSIARNLASLEVLGITECNRMVKVVEDEEDEEVVSGAQRTPLFPRLQKLDLNSLPKLVSFCQWKHVVELPSLRKVEIYKCPNMENFTMGFIATPDLGYVGIDDKIIGGAKDLNGVLQEVYLARAKVRTFTS